MGNSMQFVTERFEAILEEQKITYAKQIIREAKEQIEGGNVNTELRLNYLGLTSKALARLIPIIAQEIPNLKILNFEGNNITIVPDGIGDLSSLVTLILKDNAIESLPEDIDLLLSLKTLNLAKNAIESLSDNIYDLYELDLDRVDLTENPLSLIGLLQISAKRKSLEVFKLDRESMILLNQILSKPSSAYKVGPIARSVAKTYPNISEKEFTPFLYILLRAAPEQVRGIVEFDLPLSELGIGLDENGKLSNELDTDIPLSEELLDLLDGIKKEETSEAFATAKNLQGLSYFGIDESQMDQMDKISSVEIVDSIYQKIVKKIKETSYGDANQKMNLEELTEEDKALAKATFNYIIGEFISDQSRDEDEVEGANASLDNSSDDSIINMVVMVKPMNEERRVRMEVKQEKNRGVNSAAGRKYEMKN